jgi:sec-independent protein translocase protein TatC
VVAAPNNPTTFAFLSFGMAETETFLSHLFELRDRLIRALIALVIVFVPCFYFASPLYDLLAAPLMSALPEGTKMIATGVVTPFLIPVKVAMLVAFCIALPYLLYQAWAFVAPGLYDNEKKFAIPLVFASTVLFFLGMAFCYFVVFKMVFRFVYGFAPKAIQVAPDIENYFNFVIGMFLAFGVTFEVPIAVILLVRMGFVTVEKLKEIRPYVVVAAFVIAAVVTPPDVMSQILLAVPIWILYEAGIIVASMMAKSRAQQSESSSNP